MSKQIESVVKNLPTNESPVPEGFTSEFHQSFSKLFQNIEESSNNIVMANIVLL